MITCPQLHPKIMLSGTHLSFNRFDDVTGSATTVSAACIANMPNNEKKA